MVNKNESIYTPRTIWTNEGSKRIILRKDVPWMGVWTMFP